MNVFEFILILVGMIIIGVWGLLILANKLEIIEKENKGKK